MGRKMVGKVCILGGKRCPSKSDHQVKSQNLHLGSLSVWGGKWLEKCVFWWEGDAPAKVTIS